MFDATLIKLNIYYFKFKFETKKVNVPENVIVTLKVYSFIFC